MTEAGGETGGMTLEGQGCSLHLRILGYEYPGIETDEWDSNWLVIEGRAKLQGREWQFRDPCLTTFEVEGLAAWLEAWAVGNAAANAGGFVEPNLDFARVSDEAIRISFELESMPPWGALGDWGKRGFDIPIGPGLAVAA